MWEHYPLFLEVNHVCDVLSVLCTYPNRLITGAQYYRVIILLASIIVIIGIIVSRFNSPHHCYGGVMTNNIIVILFVNISVSVVFATVAISHHHYP